MWKRCRELSDGEGIFDGADNAVLFDLTAADFT